MNLKPMMRMSRLFLSLVLIALADSLGGQPYADPGDKPIPSHCELCQGGFRGTLFHMVDARTGEMTYMCDFCGRVPTNCHLCGLPVPKGGHALPDGRHACERDYRGAIKSPVEAQELILATIDRMERTFHGKMTFPTRSSTVSLMDRTHVTAWFAIPGNDYACPNVQGIYLRDDEDADAPHQIRILSHLPRGDTRAIYAHELTHAWLNENVPAKRRLSRDAREGFCELIAHLVATEWNDAEAVWQIERNAYTRGQFRLFREALEFHGLAKVVDWVRHGREAQLRPGDLNQIRRVDVPQQPLPELWRHSSGARSVRTTPEVAPPAAPVLKAIMWSPKAATALIGGRAVTEGDEFSMTLANGEVRFRCFAIERDRVVLRELNTGVETILTVPDAGR